MAWAQLLARPRVLPLGGVEVWRTSIAKLPVDRHILSPKEETRACSISHEASRLSFLKVRALLRRILASYTDKAPQELTFGRTSRGKPYLRTPNTALQFNVSHSRAVAFVAVSNGHAVGVDVECRTRRLRNAARFAERWLTPPELRKLHALSAHTDTDMYHQCLLEAWTRKEAFVKCTGEGIARDLRSFQVTIGPGEDCRLLTVDDSTHKAASWYLQSLHAVIAAEHDVLSTLAVAAPPSAVQFVRVIDL